MTDPNIDQQLPAEYARIVAEPAESRARLADAEAARTFALAGNARLTLVSTRTGARFTYRVRVGDDVASPHFVSVLTGQDNEADYQYLGTIFHGTDYRHGRKSKIDPTAPSARAFDWAWRCIAAGRIPDSLEVWHEGRCGRCGRALTVPESIASGIGPVCEGLS